jgi:hypothetical protein
VKIYFNKILLNQLVALMNRTTTKINICISANFYNVKGRRRVSPAALTTFPSSSEENEDQL